MTSTPSQQTGAASDREQVIKRYEDQIAYYWARGKTNKSRFITSRYLTIILGALVTAAPGEEPHELFPDALVHLGCLVRVRVQSSKQDVPLLLRELAPRALVRRGSARGTQ